MVTVAKYPDEQVKPPFSARLKTFWQAFNAWRRYDVWKEYKKPQEHDYHKDTSYNFNDEIDIVDSFAKEAEEGWKEFDQYIADYKFYKHMGWVHKSMLSDKMADTWRELWQ